MHGFIAIVEIVIIGLFIQLLLYAVHITKILYVIRVGKSKTIFGIGKIGKHFLPVNFRLVVHSIADIHQIHIVIHIQPVDIVRETGVELIEGIFRSCHVLQLVFKDNTHIEQSFLYDIFRILPFDVVTKIGETLLSMNVCSACEIKTKTDTYRRDYVAERVELKTEGYIDGFSIEDLQRLCQEVTFARGYELYGLPVNDLINLKVKTAFNKRKRYI